MIKFNEEIISIMKNVIVEKGYSVNEALVNSKAGKNLISNIRQGQAPSIDKFILLADYLSVPIDTLLGRNSSTNYIVNSGKVSVNGVQANEYNSSSHEMDGVTLEILRLVKKMKTKDKAAVLTFVCELEEKAAK